MHWNVNRTVFGDKNVQLFSMCKDYTTSFPIQLKLYN